MDVDTLSFTAENLSFSFETLKERFYDLVQADAGLAIDQGQQLNLCLLHARFRLGRAHDSIERGHRSRGRAGKATYCLMVGAKVCAEIGGCPMASRIGRGPIATFVQPSIPPFALGK